MCNCGQAASPRPPPTERAANPRTGLDHAGVTWMGAQKKTIQQMLNKEYKWGFKSDIEADAIPKGLSEDTVRLISAKKNEPEWMLEFRLKAYRRWLTMKEPTWSDNHYPPIDFNNIVYYSEPKVRPPAPTRTVAACTPPPTTTPRTSHQTLPHGRPTPLRR